MPTGASSPICSKANHSTPAQFIHWAETNSWREIAKEVGVVASDEDVSTGFASIAPDDRYPTKSACAGEARFRLSRSGGGAKIAGGATLAGERAVREAAAILKK